MATPDFILRLRERIGHELLWLPGVTAVVLRGDEVLLVRRADTGAWTPVTGICDPGEHPALTAVRECLEETGVGCEVDLLAWVGVTGVIEYPNGDRSQYVDHTFRCRYVSGRRTWPTTSRRTWPGSAWTGCRRWRRCTRSALRWRSRTRGRLGWVRDR